MMPKNDLQTNSVEGAEAFERGSAIEEYNNDIEQDDDRGNDNCREYDNCPNCETRYDLIKCNSCGYCDQYEDECNCSDSHCPCGGNKRGY
jgi:hypothetical protein